MPVPRVHAFIDVPIAQVPSARAFWSAVTGWPVGDSWHRHPEFVSLEPPQGNAYLHVQSIDAAPRVHVDLEGDPDRDCARLEGLGATRGERGDGWQVFNSPAGLPFCVCGESQSYSPPRAVTWPDGHRSRMVQLCIDVPPRFYDAELAFWQAATGWADEPVRAPEFSRLVHRQDSPLQLLVQRLGEDDQAPAARAHLDLGTDDRAAEVSRLRALGAHKLWDGDWGFTALQDPIGQSFCVTDNNPDA